MSANLLHICECLCVRLSVTYRRLNHWTDLHKIWHVSRVWPGDKHGLKISEIVTMVTKIAEYGIWPEKPLELQM